MMRTLLIAASLLALGACGSHSSTDAQADAAKTPTTAQPAATKHKTVFDDQLKALEKAKAVEKQLQDEKEKTDKTIQDQDG